MSDDGEDERNDQPAWISRALIAVAVLLASVLWGSLAWASLRAFT